MIAAATRGVDVRVRLAAPTSIHPATATNGSAARWCHNRRIRCDLIPGPALLHAKSAIIDNAIAWIGSGNLTAAAMTTNHELWARVASREFAERLALHHERIATGAAIEPFHDIPPVNENDRP